MAEQAEKGKKMTEDDNVSDMMSHRIIYEDHDLWAVFVINSPQLSVF